MMEPVDVLCVWDVPSFWKIKSLLFHLRILFWWGKTFTYYRKSLKNREFKTSTIGSPFQFINRKFCTQSNFRSVDFQNSNIAVKSVESTRPDKIQITTTLDLRNHRMQLTMKFCLDYLYSLSLQNIPWHVSGFFNWQFANTCIDLTRN